MIVSFEDLKSGRVKVEFGNLEHIEAIRRYLESEQKCDGCGGAGTIEHECSFCKGTGKKGNQ